MGRELLNKVVHTDFGQFEVVWGQGGGFDGTWDRFRRGVLAPRDWQPALTRRRARRVPRLESTSG